MDIAPNMRKLCEYESYHSNEAKIRLCVRGQKEKCLDFDMEIAPIQVALRPRTSVG